MIYMIPLATIGFVTTGILLGIYAFTFNSYIGQKIHGLKNFAYAFLSLSLAFIIWGLAALSGDIDLLSKSVLAGNALILVGSIFLLEILIDKTKINKSLIIIISTILSLAFLWWRTNYFFPHPSLNNGVMIFNTEFPVTVILGLIILSIWLPSAIKVANIIANYLKMKNLSFLYSSIYIMATIAALMLMASTTMLTILLSFIGITLCFTMLLASNVTTGKLLRTKHG